MKSKLGYLTKLSLKKKMGSKWFFVVNIVLAIAIIGIINIDQIISYFGGDFNEKIEIVVIDQTKEAYPILKSTLEESKTSLEEDFHFEFTLTDKSVEEEKEQLKDTNQILIVLEEDNTNYLKSQVISESYIDTLDYQVITQSLMATKSTLALQKSDIDLNELNAISSPIAIERIILDETKKTEAENSSMIMGTVFPIVILPVFMLTIFLVQMIGAEICEEKTTRSMEIIISNVSPKVHFASKVLASNIFVISQGLLLFCYGAIGLVIKSLFGSSAVSSITAEIGSLWNDIS